MTTTDNTQRISNQRTRHLMLTTLLALAASACAQGALDTEGLRIPSGNAGKDAQASEPEGKQSGGMWLFQPQEAAPQVADEEPAAAPVAQSDAPEPAVRPAAQVADTQQDEAVEPNAESTAEPEGSSAMRAEVETRVATQSFSAGETLAFDTHTPIAPTGLVASSGAYNGPYFGAPVLVQGDRMLVGAWADGEQASQQGAAFVFERGMDGTWTQDIKLMASDADVEPTSASWGASFGYTMAMDGDTLAISAAWDDGDEGQLDAGAVYVYELVSNSWVETKLRSPVQAEYESFGEAVEVSGDWLFVRGRDMVQGYDFNVVYVYHRVAGVWGLTQTLTSPQGAEQLAFGTSLAAGGNTLFVSAERQPNGTSDWSDIEYSVYVFEQSGGTWSQTQELFASNHAAGNGFGTLAFGGNTLVVGAPYFSDAFSYQGAAYTFEYVDSSWQEVATFTATSPRAGGYFGYTTAVDGDSFAIGSGYGDAGDALYVYERLVAGGPWTFNQSIAVAEVKSDHVGAPSFGLFGGQLFLGLPSGDTDSAVYALTGAL